MSLVLLWCLAGFCLATPCVYPEIGELLQSNTQIVVVTRLDGKCSGARRFSTAVDQWHNCELIVQGVVALPTIVIGASWVENVSITFRDIVVDPTTMASATEAFEVIRVQSFNAALRNVSIQFSNLTLDVAASGLVLRSLVQVRGTRVIDQLTIQLVGCTLRAPVTHRLLFTDVGAIAARGLRTVIIDSSVALDVRENTVGHVFGLMLNTDEDSVVTDIELLVLRSSIAVQLLQEYNASVPDTHLHMFALSPLYNGSWSGLHVLLANSSFTSHGIQRPWTAGVLQLAVLHTTQQQLLQNFCLVLRNVSVQLTSRAGSSVITIPAVSSFDAKRRTLRNVTIFIERVAANLVAQSNSTADSLPNSRTNFVFGVECNAVHNMTLRVGNVTLTSFVESSAINAARTAVVELSVFSMISESRLDVVAVHVVSRCLDGVWLDKIVPGFIVAALQAVLLRVEGAIEATDIAVTDSTLEATFGMAAVEVTAPLLLFGALTTQAAVVVFESPLNRSSILVQSCYVRLQSYHFTRLAVADKTSCLRAFGVLFGTNTTGIVVFYDVNQLRASCGQGPAPGKPDVVQATDVRIAVHASFVENPFSLLRRSTFTAIVFLPPVVASSVVVVQHSGSVNLQHLLAAVFCSGGRISRSFMYVLASHGLLSVLTVGSLNTSVTETTVFTEASSFLQPRELSLDDPSHKFALFATLGDVTMRNTNVTVALDSVVAFGVVFSSPRVVWSNASATVANTTADGVLLSTCQLVTMFLNSSGISLGLCVDAAAVSPTLTRAVAAAASSAVVVAALFLSALPATMHIEGVASVQLSMMSLQLRRRCTGNGADTQGGLIGTAISDNPTQLALPGPFGPTAGAVIGNTLIVVVGGALCGLVSTLFTLPVRRKATSDEVLRREGWIAGPSVCQHIVRTFAQRAIGVGTALLLVVVEPTVAAAVALLPGSGGAGLVVVGAICVGATVGSVAVAASYLAPSRFLLRYRTQARDQSAVFCIAWAAQWLHSVGVSFAPKQGKWVLPMGDARRRWRARTTLRLFGALIEPYRGGHQWVSLLEVAVSIVQGIIIGACSTVVGCAMVSAGLWLMLAVAAAVTLALVVVRPYNAATVALQALLMGSLTTVVLLLSALELDEAAAVVATMQSLLTLAAVLTTIFVRRVFGVPQSTLHDRKHSRRIACRDARQTFQYRRLVHHAPCGLASQHMQLKILIQFCCERRAA